MKGKKVKQGKTKQSKKLQLDSYKRYLIFNEFQKILDDFLFFELEDEHYEFIKNIISCEMIADFSDYGNSIFKLNFIDYTMGDKCFLCFIKFDLEYFIETMIWLYEDEMTE